MLKASSTSVMDPLVVPFSTTLAPMIGSPLLSRTFPVICLACCCRAYAFRIMLIFRSLIV
ncbi:hypothetical protein DWZ59_08895 [Parabacteroides merdae]|nr:hypothetical protein DWZ59_08895 [Parabacteroides merdae]